MELFFLLWKYEDFFQPCFGGRVPLKYINLREVSTDSTSCCNEMNGVTSIDLSSWRIAQYPCSIVCQRQKWYQWRLVLLQCSFKTPQWFAILHPPFVKNNTTLNLLFNSGSWPTQLSVMTRTRDKWNICQEKENLKEWILNERPSTQ